MNLSRTVVISLGSNLGDSVRVLRGAIDELRRFADGEFRSSSLWRTKPIDCPPGSPDFVNAVVMFEMIEGLEPADLLRKLQAMEDSAGRQPKEILNEPRPLDLDIVAFGRETLNSNRLTIPHPRAHMRRFVLDPLAEIFPSFQAPGWKHCARDLADNLDDDEPPVRAIDS